MKTRVAVEAEVADILSRGVATYIDPEGTFKENLIKKALGEYPGDLIIKFGVDPTRPDIHLGHAVVLRALRRMQDLGAKVVFLVGDFTAQIGDPTGKSKVRPEVAFTEIEHNMRTYLEQVGKILRTDPAVFSWIRNSDWFFSISDIAPDPNKQVTLGVSGPHGQAAVPLIPGTAVWKAAAFEETRMQKTVLKNTEIHDVTLRGFLAVLRKITHSRLIERDMFEERIKKGEELYMHEMMYPVLQGVDSHILSKVYGACDLEVGGTDQTFNMIMGRDVMRATGVRSQAVLAFTLLPGTDGVEKMSKSLDNYIGITDTPADMFGKTMSVPDALIPLYLELATYAPKEEVAAVAAGLEKGATHPKEAKTKLARAIVAMYHGEAAASEAEAAFTNTFANKTMPADAPRFSVAAGASIADVLYANKIIDSKSEWARLVKAGAVSTISGGTETKLSDPRITVSATTNLRVGKHRFVVLEVAP